MNYLQVIEVLGRMNKQLRILKIEEQIIFQKRNIEKIRKKIWIIFIFIV